MGGRRPVSVYLPHEAACVRASPSEGELGKTKGPTRPPSPTWRSFLANHVDCLASVDFFVVPTVTFKLLYVFLVLSHDRRRLVHFGVTAHPTAEWAARQVREAFPFDRAPRYLLRDRDAAYGDCFRECLECMGIEEVRSAPRSPWQKEHAPYYTASG